ncbi:hypothetical protein WMY93_014059 [Mugilogobius chulae]|uniref:RPGRIP1 C-terminal domain-containing protein n=1 Tax=Mugilogobius chulae TaxID=88201 RepID=A0AAW0NXP5_9GOBI
MSPVVDETAGDVPVRDVGLRGGLMPAVPDSVRDPKAAKRHHHHPRTKMEPQRVFRAPRDQLEELCLRLQEENSVLKQHSRSQEQRIRRMSTRLSRARQTRPGSTGVRDRDLEENIQELEARVALLEGQKQLLQERLGLAKQHLLELGGASTRYNKGRSCEAESGARRATHTAPARYGPALDDCHRLGSSGPEQLHVAQLELTAQTLRDTLRDRDRELQDRELQELRRTQVHAHRLTIRENVELLRVQKQLSEKSSALRLTEEKLLQLQEAFEKQLEESQRSLENSQDALLQKVEELRTQLKDERQKSLDLETTLSSTSLQERVCDLEAERDLIKQSYDSLLQRTFSEAPEKIHSREPGQELPSEVLLLRDALQTEREKVRPAGGGRREAEGEIQQLRERKERPEQEKLSFGDTGETQKLLEQQVLHYKDQVSSLQLKLDSVAQAFDMSVEDLSQTLFQIKEFRLQQESRAGLGLLHAEQNPPEVAHVQASHAETVLELQKTRELLRVEHNIGKDLQEELKLMKQRMEREREESSRRSSEKDKLLSKRSLQISTLQAQLKELGLQPRNYKRTIPLQYTWPGVDQETVQPVEDDLVSTLLHPLGLQSLDLHTPLSDSSQDDPVTFCTYSLLDFELLSTALDVGEASQLQAFTSSFVLTPPRPGASAAGGKPSGAEPRWSCTRPWADGTVCTCVCSAGPDGGAVGLLDFWARLHPPAEPVESEPRRTCLKPSQRSQRRSLWEVLDFGAGVPNELLVTLERCVGLTSRWPGLLPDAYLTYRLYDLPPHASPTMHCCSDPVFNHSTCFPWPSAPTCSAISGAAVCGFTCSTRARSRFLRCICQDSGSSASADLGRDIRGEHATYLTVSSSSEWQKHLCASSRRLCAQRRSRRSSRDGRVTIKWKYPFKTPKTTEKRRDMSSSREEKKEEPGEKKEEAHRPTAKPRSSAETEERSSARGPVGDAAREEESVQEVHRGTTRPTTGPTTSPHTRSSPSRGRSVRTQRRSASSSSPPLPQQQTSEQQDSESGEFPNMCQEHELVVCTTPGSDSSQSSSGAVFGFVGVPEQLHPQRLRAGHSSAPSSCEPRPRLRVEILSLRLEPGTPLALDKSVQRLFVEYRLLGVPLQSTETPESLRKPGAGQEVHYNFSRVIYVDGTHAAPLRHYLFTMLEGTDPHQGRLKFTVVSEPMDQEDECVDVGHAFLNLRELLETGQDVLERDIQIVGVDEDSEDREVIGHLKVSLEAAVALSGIYDEFQQNLEDKDDTEKEKKEEKKERELRVTEFDQDSDF